MSNRLTDRLTDPLRTGIDAAGWDCGLRMESGGREGGSGGHRVVGIVIEEIGGVLKPEG